MKSNDVILQTVANIVLFIILMFSVFLFFNGHHEPGGGFIGGLMTSSALVLLLLAYDLETVKRILPVDFKLVTAAGLLVAVGTGMGSFFFGAPFLSQTYDYFHFPVLGELELATALIFDVGVYLVVVGITLTIIQTIGEDR
ncbi:Na(+)/H(+) antiporter subunit B [Salibacterium halotolerans]|uniref:Multicomponent Na+:H+ antiporter subunit B n=1 Tax=Salibacterium halotolerans TaxID=1884432 RepID=A0A1I5ND94_9BACI|nr:Na(+)/H(+) antiporter subunit B [Salibacterium halotolerans]SFP19763.1 multicomponent Na+:H+ antiporter subunit B [Salibacterium halotolerans]